MNRPKEIVDFAATYLDLLGSNAIVPIIGLLSYLFETFEDKEPLTFRMLIQN
jgi:hypothetical protein